MARPNRDHTHLQVLREYVVQFKVLPSYAKLGDVLGFRSKTAAVKVADRLVESGYLERTPGGRLAPTTQFFALPQIENTLRAGLTESTSWSGGMEAHAIDRLLVDHPSRTILVPIRGDSMVNAGVFDGDTAVVERTTDAVAGDFVAAVVDGQYTIKELRYERRKPVLVPHNNQYETIRPEVDLQILGVVRGIVRRYERAHRTVRDRGKQA